MGCARPHAQGRWPADPGPRCLSGVVWLGTSHRPPAACQPHQRDSPHKYHRRVLHPHQSGLARASAAALGARFWYARYAAASATELAALEGFKLSTEAFFGLWRVKDDDFNHQSGFSWFGNSRTRCTVAIFWCARSAVDTAATEYATSPRWSHWTWRRTEAVQSLFGARAHAGQQHQSL